MSDGSVGERIFSTIEGRLLNDSNFYDRIWPQIVKSLGLPAGPTFYSLKHLGNSFAQAAGVMPEAQRKKMRHSSTQQATTTYRVVGDSELDRATAVFDELFPNGASAV